MPGCPSPAATTGATRRSRSPSWTAAASAWPRGRVLGGSGSVNGLVFLRGSPHDYDRWAQAGARGWAWDDVMPVLPRAGGLAGPAGRHPRPRRTGAGQRAEGPVARRRGVPRRVPQRRLSAEPGRERRRDRGRLPGADERARRAPHQHRAGLPAPGAAAAEPARGDRRVGPPGGGGAGPRDGGGGGHAGRPRACSGAAREVVLCGGAIASPHLLLVSGIGDGGGVVRRWASPPCCTARRWGRTCRTT